MVFNANFRSGFALNQVLWFSSALRSILVLSHILLMPEDSVKRWASPPHGVGKVNIKVCEAFYSVNTYTVIHGSRNTEQLILES